MRALISLALTLAVCLMSGEERWSTPVLGAVFDADGKTIRPVLGVPGAASLGDAVPVPDKIDRAFVAPDGPYAVVTGAEGTAVVSWTGGDVHSVRLENAVVPVGASWSGSKVAIYNSEGAVQVWQDGKLLDLRTVEPGQSVSLCGDTRTAVGVCGPDGDYSLDESGLIRTREGKRELVAEGSFSAIAAYRGVVAVAGTELLVLGGNEPQRTALRTNAVSVQAMRTPGVFVVSLDDGSVWIYGDGELQLLDGGRR